MKKMVRSIGFNDAICYRLNQAYRRYPFSTTIQIPTRALALQQNHNAPHGNGSMNERPLEAAVCVQGGFVVRCGLMSGDITWGAGISTTRYYTRLDGTGAAARLPHRLAHGGR
jgi:hypothetical protein